MLRLKDTDVSSAWGSLFGRRLSPAHLRPARAMLTGNKISKRCSWRPLRAEQRENSISTNSEESLTDLQMALQVSCASVGSSLTEVQERVSREGTYTSVSKVQLYLGPNAIVSRARPAYP